MIFQDNLTLTFLGSVPGNALLSQKVARLVPSALKGLTTVFGMGTGVTLSLLNYQGLYYYKLNKKRSQKSFMLTHKPQ